MALPFVELKKGQGYDDIPDHPYPFYVLAKEGIYLRKKTAIGTSIIKIDKMPTSLGEVGNPTGFFSWGETPPVPPEICAQIVDFFRRIWDKHRTEAEVLLTARIEMNDGVPSIKEWRVFIPTQKVSMGGVQSVYEPSHIARGHMVVGTMHSHCNFSAFHSGTDLGDANRMDGVHFTIGFVDRDEPQVVAMVSISGVHVNYKPEALGDFSNLKAATAPTWWDNYVTPSADINTGGHKPVGYNNFDKYPSYSGYQGGYGNRGAGYWHGYDDGYGGEYGRYTPPSTTPNPNTPLISAPKKEDDKPKTIREERLARLAEKQNHGQTQNPTIGEMLGLLGALDSEDAEWLKKHGYNSLQDFLIADSDDALLPDDTKHRDDTRSTDQRSFIDDIKQYADEEYWEERFDRSFVDAIFDAELLSDNEVDDIIRRGKSVDETFFQLLFLEKLRGLGKVLKMLGIDLTVDLSYNENLLKQTKSKRKQRRERRIQNLLGKRSNRGSRNRSN